MDILQWNIRGLLSHREDLHLLICTYVPEIICIQETKLQNTYPLNLRNYRCLCSDLEIEDEDYAHGGVVIFIKEDVFYTLINLETNLQAIAAHITIRTLTYTICNIYFPPGERITSQQIMDIISQLPPPFIILDDMNAHSPLWGSERQYLRGKMITSLVRDLNLGLLNTGEATYLLRIYVALISVGIKLNYL